MRCMNTKSEVPTCAPTMAMKGRYTVSRSRGCQTSVVKTAAFKRFRIESHVVAAKSIHPVSTCVGLRSTPRHALVELIPSVPVVVHPCHRLDRTRACGRHY